MQNGRSTGLFSVPQSMNFRNWKIHSGATVRLISGFCRSQQEAFKAISQYQSTPADSSRPRLWISLDFHRLQQVEAFLADNSPTAYETVVDRLLASPRFGEHMAATWLDAARYADTSGYQNDGPQVHVALRARLGD